MSRHLEVLGLRRPSNQLNCSPNSSERRLALYLKAVSFLVGLMLGGLGLCAGPNGARASDAIDPRIITDSLIGEIRGWLSQDVVILSVRAQNDRHDGLSQADIDSLDQRWRKERRAQEQPLIARTLNNPLSLYLTQVQALALGLYCEIFVTDAKGLNVGQSSITADYWQGDEDKWLKTMPVGPDAVFIDTAEFHDATATWRAQISLTLQDPETRRPLGAATIEVNLTELDRRQRAGLL